MKLADPALLALDYDGTLAPIVADPQLAFPAEGAVAALTACTARFAGVAVVTGRPAMQLLTLLGAEVPGLIVLGHYGLERWTADTGLVSPPVHHELGVVRELVAKLVEGTDARIEDKGHSVAVHTRTTPNPVGLLNQLQPELATIAAANGLVLEPGRLVLELRPADSDKGVTLRRLVQECDPATVLYAGDDLGDRAAYDALDQLAPSGLSGVRVFADSAEGPAELRERADVVVDGPAGVVDLLRQLSG